MCFRAERIADFHSPDSTGRDVICGQSFQSLHRVRGTPPEKQQLRLLACGVDRVGLRGASVSSTEGNRKTDGPFTV